MDTSRGVHYIMLPVCDLVCIEPHVMCSHPRQLTLQLNNSDNKSNNNINAVVNIAIISVFKFPSLTVNVCACTVKYWNTMAVKKKISLSHLVTDICQHCLGFDSISSFRDCHSEFRVPMPKTFKLIISMVLISIISITCWNTGHTCKCTHRTCETHYTPNKWNAISDTVELPLMYVIHIVQSINAIYYTISVKSASFPFARFREIYKKRKWWECGFRKFLSLWQVSLSWRINKQQSLWASTLYCHRYRLNSW